MQTQMHAPASPVGSTSRIPFPQPEKINGRNYWRRRALRVWDSARLGLPAPEISPDDDVLLTSKQVCTLYGGISVMSLWRWTRDEKAAA